MCSSKQSVAAVNVEDPPVHMEQHTKDGGIVDYTRADVFLPVTQPPVATTSIDVTQLTESFLSSQQLFILQSPVPMARRVGHTLSNVSGRPDRLFIRRSSYHGPSHCRTPDSRQRDYV